MNDFWHATIGAQRLMVGLGAPIQIDGVWGARTQRAYEELPPDARAQVDSFLASKHTSAIKVRGARMAEKSRLRVVSATPSVQQAIANASSRTGVPIDILTPIARIESGFDPKAVKGESRGLFQIQPGAWSDVRGQHPDIPPYLPAVWDPVWNAVVAGFYVRQNMRTLTRIGYRGPLDGPAIYLAHQQGAGGLTELYNFAVLGIVPKKSVVTKAALLSNPAPDGKGPTADKAAFYRRWRAIAEKRFAS